MLNNWAFIDNAAHINGIKSFLCNSNLVYLLSDRNKERNETNNLDYTLGLQLYRKSPRIRRADYRVAARVIIGLLSSISW